MNPIVAASGWEIALTVGGFGAVVVGLIVLQVWSQRRKRRGDEAGTSNAEGAEAMIPPRWH